jgi:hypothetical protein
MALGALLIASGSSAAEPVAARLIAANSYPILFEGGVLSGPGASFLERSTADSQFVLLGESHYERDIPVFAGALFAMLHARHGFHHVVVEQDPLAMEDALAPGRRGDAEKLGALAHAYPSLFEYGSDQDLRFLAEVGRMEKGEMTICGAEQATGAVRYFDELVKLAPDAAIAAEVRKLRAEAAKLDAEPKYSVHFLIAADTGSRLARLSERWRPKRGSRADWLLRALMTSAEIFGYYRRAEAGEYVGLYNNTVREDWLKRRFASCYAMAAKGERLPRALFKFGANHMYHGMNATSTFPIGNLAHEFAIMNGMDAYGIMTVSLGRGKGYAGVPEWLRALLPNEPPTQPVIIDLQPLRPVQRPLRLQRKVEDQESFRRVLHGYEALLIIPDSAAADMRLSGLSSP